MTAPRRTALITGSTGGIGAATAAALAADGFHVIVTGRNTDRAGAVVADIARAGGSATFVASDLTGPPDALRAVAQEAPAAAGGHLDVLVRSTTRPTWSWPA